MRNLSSIFLVAFVIISSQNVSVNGETYTNTFKYEVLCEEMEKVSHSRAHFVPENIVRGFTDLVRSELVHNRGLENNPKMIEQTVISRMEQCFPSSSQPMLYYDKKKGKTVFANKIKQRPGTYNGYVGIFAKDNSTIQSTDPITSQQSGDFIKNTVVKQDSVETGVTRISQLDKPQVKNEMKKPK